MELSKIQILPPNLQELLDTYEYPGDETPIIRGSALKALESDDPDSEDAKAIFELLEILDTEEPFVRLVQDPPLAVIELTHEQ